MSVASEHRVVRLADDADETGLIEGRTYEDVVIQGPAVVVPVGPLHLESNTWVVEPNGLFIEFPEGTTIQGAIGLRDVTIRGCELRNVAIAGTPKVIAQLQAEFQFPEAAAVQAAPAAAPH